MAKPVEPDALVDLVDRLASEARREAAQTPPAITARADVLEKFARTLATAGLHDALRFLNSRTAHRFTGLYRFDPPWLRSLALWDAHVPGVMRGDDVEMDATYCALVGTFERPFTTEGTAADERLRHHPARDTVRSYCGVLLWTASRHRLRHPVPLRRRSLDVPSQEIALMEAAARLITERLERDDDQTGR